MEPAEIVVLCMAVAAIPIVLGIILNVISFFAVIDTKPPSPPKPTVTITHEEKDEQGRRHCLDNYAVKYSNGKTEYWVHGVQFSKEMFNNIFIKKTYTPQQIMAMHNAEQKSVVIKCIGFDYILEAIKDYEIIDEESVKSKVTKEPLLYQVIDFNISPGQKVRVVKVQDHTTGKTTCLGVPIIPQTHTCMGAIAWTFGMDLWDYNPEVEA